MIHRIFRKLRGTYRDYLADWADALLCLSDGTEFTKTWNEVSPILHWDHRPSARRLWELASIRGKGTIVEIGSYLGNSTVYLARAGGEVHAIDPHSTTSMSQVPSKEDISSQFLQNTERFSVRNDIVYHRVTSAEASRQWNKGTIRLLFIDGLHTHEAVLTDYCAWEKYLAPEHVVLFDDFLWPEVEKAVRELRAKFKPKYFYVRGGQAMFSTRRLGLRQAGFI